MLFLLFLAPLPDPLNFLGKLFQFFACLDGVAFCELSFGFLESLFDILDDAVIGSFIVVAIVIPQSPQPRSADWRV